MVSMDTQCTFTNEPQLKYLHSDFFRFSRDLAIFYCYFFEGISAPTIDSSHAPDMKEPDIVEDNMSWEALHVLFPDLKQYDLTNGIKSWGALHDVRKALDLEEGASQEEITSKLRKYSLLGRALTLLSPEVQESMKEFPSNYVTINAIARQVLQIH